MSSSFYLSLRFVRGASTPFVYQFGFSVLLLYIMYLRPSSDLEDIAVIGSLLRMLCFVDGSVYRYSCTVGDYDCLGSYCLCWQVDAIIYVRSFGLY